MKCTNKIIITSRALFAHIEDVNNIITKKRQQQKRKKNFEIESWAMTEYMHIQLYIHIQFLSTHIHCTCTYISILK